ncbi:uncharacterized protein LOC116609995 [Nematostella vectensis]|uniref:uncharacterized protein LOC116609995 n=1 Tax=Nematostella vectensis TaxID=45351 RepID=UPI002077507D|nr:uncharacterized protein LOC116609995 [Nematostella vectensis]
MRVIANTSHQMLWIYIIACNIFVTTIEARGVSKLDDLSLEDWYPFDLDEKSRTSGHFDNRNVRPPNHVIQTKRGYQGGNPCQSVLVNYKDTRDYETSELKRIELSHDVYPNLEQFKVTMCRSPRGVGVAKAVAGCLMIMDCITHNAPVTFFYKSRGAGCSEWIPLTIEVPVGCQCWKTVE